MLPTECLAKVGPYHYIDITGPDNIKFERLERYKEVDGISVKAIVIYKGKEMVYTGQYALNISVAWGKTHGKKEPINRQENLFDEYQKTSSSD